MAPDAIDDEDMLMPPIPKSMLGLEEKQVRVYTLMELRRINARLKEVQVLVHEHDKEIKGNGKPGLRTTVPLMSNRINGLYWMTGTMFLALLVNIALLIFGA